MDYIYSLCELYYIYIRVPHYHSCIRHTCTCTTLYYVHHLVVEPRLHCLQCTYMYTLRWLSSSGTTYMYIYVTSSPSPSSGDEDADHVISNTLMRVIWSHGQVYPDYFHWPSSGIEAGTAPNDRFYQPDEIKYHGGRNRGATSINFFGWFVLIDVCTCTCT